MFIHLIATVAVLTLFCSCSSYKNAPLGRHALPVEWSGVWTVESATGADSQRGVFCHVIPVNATMSKLIWMTWNAKPADEAYAKTEYEVSQCEIEGESIGCVKVEGRYQFGVVKTKSNQIAVFPISNSGWKEDWSPEEMGRGIAELVRKETGTPKWDAALIKNDGSNGVLLRKTNLKALPEPPSGLVAKAEQRKQPRNSKPAENSKSGGSISAIPPINGPLKIIDPRTLLQTKMTPVQVFVTPGDVAHRLSQAEQELSRGYFSVGKMTAEMTLPQLLVQRPEHAEAIARAKIAMSNASLEMGLACKDDRADERLQHFTRAVTYANEGVPVDSGVRESLVIHNPNLMARLVAYRGYSFTRISSIFHRLSRHETAEKFWERGTADMEEGLKLATQPAIISDLHTRIALSHIMRFKLGLDVGPSTKLAIVHSAEAVRTADSDPMAVLAQAEAYYARALATVIVAHQSGVRDLADTSLEPIWRDIGHVVKLTSGEFHNTPVSAVARRLQQTKPDRSAGVSELAAGIFRSLVNVSDPFQMPQAEVEEMQRQGNAIMHDANAAAQARGLPAPYPAN